MVCPCAIGSNASARGLAADARDVGLAKHLKGFEKGGKLRRLANAIVHAPVGTAYKHMAEAAKLRKLASKK